jgi:hypothetical protein
VWAFVLGEVINGSMKTTAFHTGKKYFITLIYYFSKNTFLFHGQM